MLCALTACDSTRSLRELRAAPPASDAYQAALAATYADYAGERETAYDWWTSKYFADKGLMAAYGRDIKPEDPANWNIPATLTPQLVDAREKLLIAIANNRATQPEMTASAVVAYDRWLELQHNGWNAEAIEEQRDAFFAILTKLEEAHTASDDQPITAPAESTSTILYFPLNSDTLGDSAQAALAQLVDYVQTAGNVTININGHADRSGSAPYNMRLSERRAMFVMRALKAAGVPESLMRYFAFGETDPAIPTPDGAPEPRNRRVEIYFE
jgi:OOP family OmpA-OmpF porin